MSYCRFEGGKSDIYLIGSAKAGKPCHVCYFGDGKMFLTFHPKEMLGFIKGMKECGKKIPQRAINRLESECKKEHNK